MQYNNKRNYFRVDIFIPVKWRILDKDETDMVKKDLGSTLLTQSCFKNPVEDAPEKASSSISNDLVYSSMQLLNNKLDYIINMMLSDSGTASARDSIVEISASGLKFRTSEKIETGIFLKMDLLIPGTSFFHMELVAETLRVEKRDKGYLIAANIIFIDDEAREFIIKMIFHKERLDIRRQKSIKGEAKHD